MPPTAQDLQLGQALATRLVDAGQGRTRRVSMIGSRAQGRAGPHSDLDVVVVVEPPADRRPWTTADAHAERRRLQEAVGPPPVRTDLWVCTTDLFEEGRSVVGGVESLVEFEGFDLYRRDYDRPAVVRRSPDQVRRENVRGWLEQALAAYQRATAIAGPQPGGARDVPTAAGAPAAAWKSARATVNALLVSHQVRTAKHDPLDEVLEKLHACDPAIAAWLRGVLPGETCAPATAGAILHATVRRLARDGAMAPLVTPVASRLAAASAPRPVA